MINKYRYQDALWIDLAEPTADEVLKIAEEYGLEKTTAESLLSPSSKHRVHFHEKVLHIILHFPAYRDSKNGDAAFELDIVASGSTIITARYGQIEALEKFVKALEANHLPDLEIKNARDQIFFGLLRELLASFEHKLSKIDHFVREVEKKMFAGMEKAAILEISEASRHLTDFRRITSVYPEAFRTLEEEGEKHLGKEFSHEAHRLQEVFEKGRVKLGVLSDIVRELRETNGALLTAKQNDLTKMLALIALATDIVVGVTIIYLTYLSIRK